MARRTSASERVRTAASVPRAIAVNSAGRKHSATSASPKTASETARRPVRRERTRNPAPVAAKLATCTRTGPTRSESAPPSHEPAIAPTPYRLSTWPAAMIENPSLVVRYRLMNGSTIVPLRFTRVASPWIQTSRGSPENAAR